MSFIEEMENFQQAILDGNFNKTLNALKTIPQSTPKERLDIYIDGYNGRLVKVLEETYPATVNYIGNARASAMFSEFANKNPSTYKNIDRYALSIVDWVKTKTDEQALIEILTYEAAINEVYFMPESTAIDANEIAKLSPEELGNITLLPRTAHKIFAFEFDVETYLNSFRESGAGELNEGKTYIYILRHNNKVQRHVLMHEEYLMLGALFSGLELNQAIEKLSSTENVKSEILEQNFQIWFQKWFAEGYFKKI